MAKQVVANYTFSAAGKTVTLTDWSTVRLDRLILIVNVTRGNAIMYNFADSSIATATVATNVITLSAVTASSADTDKLMIFYDALTADTTYDTSPVKAADGDVATIGAKADAKSSATDTTAITMMSVLKQISYQLQQQQPTIINKFKSVTDTVTTGGTVETVDLDTSAFTTVVEVSVIDMDGTDDMYVTVGTTTASPPDPVGGTSGNSEVIPGGVPAVITWPNDYVGTSLRVKILCATTAAQFAVVVRGT